MPSLGRKESITILSLASSTQAIEKQSNSQEYWNWQFSVDAARYTKSKLSSFLYLAVYLKSKSHFVYNQDSLSPHQ